MDNLDGLFAHQDLITRSDEKYYFQIFFSSLKITTLQNKIVFSRLQFCWMLFMSHILLSFFFPFLEVATKI